MKVKTNYIALSIPVILALVAIFFLYKQSRNHTNNYLLGMAETKVVYVASEIPGRIDSLLVEAGDMVEKGQILALYEPNILDAKLAQAQGVLHAAEGLVDKAETGARTQEKQAAKSQFDMAKSQFEFAEKTYKRFKVLFADSIISTQEMDEVEFKYQAAKDQMKMAKAVYDMAEEGARKEDIAMAKGKYAQANAVYQEAQAFYKELEIRAPVSGEISSQIAEVGEVVAAGYPVYSIQIPEEIYVILQLREDLLPQFKKNTQISGYIPALDIQHDFKVSFLAPMADFANWVPTREKGSFEMKTFEVHLKPVEPIENFRPGMTVKFER
jgi:HlyD family secretion protein